MVSRARAGHRARDRDLERRPPPVRAAGPYVCGRFSIADAFYAPVAFRFRTYAVEPEGAAGGYLQALLAHPFLREWEGAALAETAIIEADEPRIIYRDKIAPPRHG